MDYEKLTNDLVSSLHATKLATESINDGGTANLDKVFLTIPRAREIKVLEAIKEAGLYCRGKRRWIGDGYMLTVSSGQGIKREKAVSVFIKSMESLGWDVVAYRQMD